MLQQTGLAGKNPVREFLGGMRAIFPLIVAVLPIGLVFGAVSATKGLSALETTLMSALVFAGGSQFVAMDIWTHPASWIGVGFAALLVNIRHVLMGASIGTKMQCFSGIKRYIAMKMLPALPRTRPVAFTLAEVMVDAR